jgi:hypothetical protein
MSLDITYNWNFNPLECYPTEAGQTDVVFNVHWQLYATTGSYNASSIGTQAVGPLGTGSFTPFEELTKEQVQGWVVDAINAYDTGSVDRMYANLATQIENQINPPTVTLPAPWLNQPTTTSTTTTTTTIEE